MRNLVVCCDGTWNTPDQEKNEIPAPTNVYRFHNAVDDTTTGGRPQLRYYHPGVGTDGNWWHRLRGGAFGHGLNQNIMSAYRWLAAEYRAGDRIFLIGFSRGAYTARSLGGWICSCGLLDLRRLKDPAQWERIETCFERGYRKKKKDWRKDGWKLHAGDAKDGQVGIWFVGVWDTVGALGIPDDLAVLNVLDDRGDFVFHDTKLSDKVVHARHALAIDEERGSFSPTVWKSVASRKNVEQVWFAGSHGDVGGGYAEAGLSDIALKWMIDAAETAGLAFRKGMREQVHPDPRGVEHKSLRGFYKKLRTTPRSVPEIDPAARAKSVVHPSVVV